MATFDGPDVISAIYAWWTSPGRASLEGTTNQFWHVLASIGTPMPYTTFFLVSEVVDTDTTSFAFWRSTVQFNFHAAVDDEAVAAGDAFRAALEGAPLSIGGNPALHVLATRNGIEMSDEVGDGGAEVWVDFEVFEVAWTD